MQNNMLVFEAKKVAFLELSFRIGWTYVLLYFPWINQTGEKWFVLRTQNFLLAQNKNILRLGIFVILIHELEVLVNYYRLKCLPLYFSKRSAILKGLERFSIDHF